jgi:glutaredoxin
MNAKKKQAVLYRMVTPEHTCPYGLKARYLLRSRGYEVQDNLLTTREATEAFMKRYEVSKTPQTFIDGKRIGGYEDVRRFFGYRVPGPDDTTYKPVIALFSVAFLLAVAIEFLTGLPISGATLIPNFIAVAMVLLALQKLKDVESFSAMFLNYDLLAKRWVPYSYVYPYVELVAGVLMLAHILPVISIPAAFFIGGIGAVSVIKAVYIDKRELKCACVGGDTKVPLGFVSLSENLMMIGMAVWMFAMYL